ncbi:MAG: VOC family protein [Rhodocyclaceae bacterium]|nr:VOC family protein [Rhodocyclaceae bacterium]
MIAYCTLGTRDMTRATAFYDALLAELGAKRVLEWDRMVAWGNAPGAPMLSVVLPYDGQEATAGNGTMVALSVGSPDVARRMHAKALEMGGSDEGAPGPRIEGQFYCAYFRDPDGNKLNLFCMNAPA